MYRMGIIEESINDRGVLRTLEPYFVSQRVENVPEDECPIWHINEYHVPEDEIEKVADILIQHIKETWYVHAFNDKSLLVVLKGKWFQISLTKDKSWGEMIEYGVEHAKVERQYLESIPLHI